MPVAVRSSATAEDSADASFAGQQDTYLWVVGEDGRARAVRRCWASLFSARSIAYRRERGIDGGRLLMGVVVQRMVRADAAGVAMTLNPSNGDRCVGRDRVELRARRDRRGRHASRPTRFLVDKVMLEIVETQIADKQRRARRRRRRRPRRRARRSTRSAGACPRSATDQVRAVARARQARRAALRLPAGRRVGGRDGDVRPAAPEPPRDRLVAQGEPPRTRVTYSTGLAGIVDTLVNPLASRRSTDDRAGD